jgi:septal ring factor EnvC (AmiA/AmiB activator)
MAKSENNEIKKQVAGLEKQVAELKSKNTGLEKQVAELNGTNKKLEAKNAAFTRLHKDWLAGNSDSRFYAAEVARVLGVDA